MVKEDTNSSSMELAERWRVAGRVLRLVDPVAFEALLVGAEIMIVEGIDTTEEINEVYHLA